MLHPSYSELMTKINDDAGHPLVQSRYTIVMSTAKRARQLVDKGYHSLPDHSKKPLSIAVDELYDGDIRILTEEEDAEYKERFAAKLAEEAARRAAEEAARRAEEEALRQADLEAMKREEDEDDEDDDEEDEDDFADDAALAAAADAFFADEKEDQVEG